MPRQHTVYTVIFQLREACNSRGVFSSLAHALAYVQTHFLTDFMSCGAADYGGNSQTMKVFRTIQRDLDQLELQTRISSAEAAETADEIWIDLDYRNTPHPKTKPSLQPAVYTITRHIIDDLPDTTTDNPVPFIHPPPKRLQ